MAVYGLAIFLSAFLLFQVQLFLAKYLLPWFGGVPAVWTTCMLFFQVLLLGGYTYAHWLNSHAHPRVRRPLHTVLLAGCLVLFGVLYFNWGSPLLPDAAWRPAPGVSPIWQIVRLLTVAVGLPFFVLASTGPLVQAWFSRAYPTTSPYRLYALSNAGSLLGLMSYPLLIEVWLPLKTQTLVWTTGFAVFVVSMLICIAGAVRAKSVDVPAAPVGAQQPVLARYVLWFALAACASTLLLATTNQMSQEVAVVPLLWMLPLCLYLLSFILCFGDERWYARGIYAALLVLGLVSSVFVLHQGVDAHLLIQISVPAATLFVACMLCHGELARLKPAPRHLTSFYLTLTAGGAAGGLLVGLAAPLLFRGMWEYPIALWLTASLVLLAFWRDRDSPLYTRPNWPVYATLIAAAAVALYSAHSAFGPSWENIADHWRFGVPIGAAIAVLAWYAWMRRQRPAGVTLARSAIQRAARLASTGALVVLSAVLVYLVIDPATDTVHQSRNFYGMLRVTESYSDPGRPSLLLNHGRIVHGKQYQTAGERREPTTYYGRDSGVGLAIHHHPRRFSGLRIGVVGFGIGTLASYGMRGDLMRIYEINPDLLTLAGPGADLFTYVHDSNARIEFAIGDARIELERELSLGRPQRFHVLALDAFSSDSIPVHLLTREALDVYLRHLAPDGILAIHISNRGIELAPVVRALAQHAGLTYLFISPGDGELTWKNTWALLARDPRLLAVPAIADAAEKEENTDVILWTDDYSNLLRVLKL